MIGPYRIAGYPDTFGTLLHTCGCLTNSASPTKSRLAKLNRVRRVFHHVQRCACAVQT